MLIILTGTRQKVFLSSLSYSSSCFSSLKCSNNRHISKQFVVTKKSSSVLSSFSSMPHYWNRETSEKQDFDLSVPISKYAKIVSLSDSGDENNVALHEGKLPDGARVLAIGSSLEELDLEMIKKEEPNVIFVSHPMARKPLEQLLRTLPSVEWVHARSAGLDFITSPGLASSTVTLTNAKGHFSSTLAEYTLMACSYFAKDLPRLMRQKKNKEWGKYNVEELRGKTLGIIGYGDIGRSCAKLAHAYGMRIVALRRNPHLAEDDPLCDACYGNDKASVNLIMNESDYILVATPLTEETRGLIDKEAFQNAKPNSVFINVGRGPIADENALIDALTNGKLKGAALDVFSIEPLPTDSPLWELDNVLISPHNMDQTATFMKEGTDFFVQENLPRYLRGLKLLNKVDSKQGY